MERNPWTNEIERVTREHKPIGSSISCFKANSFQDDIGISQAYHASNRGNHSNGTRWSIMVSGGGGFSSRPASNKCIITFKFRDEFSDFSLFKI